MVSDREAMHEAMLRHLPHYALASEEDRTVVLDNLMFESKLLSYKYGNLSEAEGLA